MEAHRDRRRFRPFGSFGQDLAYGARMLVRSPGFTLVAVLTLAIGILATTTTFSAVDAVLFRPLAIDEPAEVLQIFTGTARGGKTLRPSSAIGFTKACVKPRPCSMGCWPRGRCPNAVNVAPSAASRASYAGRLQGEVVSGNYFTLLGVRTSHGRLFTDNDDSTPDAHPVAVIGEAFWKNHLAADPDIVGRLVNINGHPFNVIGVAPASFTGTVFAAPTDFWVPLMMQGMMQGRFGMGPGPQWHIGAMRHYVMACDNARGGRGLIGGLRPAGELPKFNIPPGAKNCGPVRELGYLRVFGRLPGNVSRTAAESQLNVIAGHLAEPLYPNEARRFTLEPEVESRHKGYSSQVRPFLAPGTRRIDPGLAHRVRQRSQSAAHARERTQARAGHPTVARRESMARRTATADGERSRRDRGWRHRHHAHLLDIAGAEPRDSCWPDSRHQSRLQSGSSRARLGARPVGPDRSRIRHGAGVAVCPHQPASRAETRRQRQRERRPSPDPAQRAGRGAIVAVRHRADRCRIVHPQPPDRTGVARSGLQHQPPGLHAIRPEISGVRSGARRHVLSRPGHQSRGPSHASTACPS